MRTGIAAHNGGTFVLRMTGRSALRGGPSTWSSGLGWPADGTGPALRHGLDQVGEIIVLDRGKVAERGTHHELAAAGGSYQKAARAGQRSGGPEMTCTVHVAWDEELAGYDFGPGHPLAPVRVELTIELARALGVLDEPGVSVAAPGARHRRASSSSCTTRGTSPRCGWPGRRADPRCRRGLFGMGTEDDPVFPGMHEASALVAGATLAAARAVWSGHAEHGASIAGGLHHAMRGKRQRLLRLQRPGHRHRRAAVGRAPSGSPTSTSTSTTATASRRRSTTIPGC